MTDLSMKNHAELKQEERLEADEADILGPVEEENAELYRHKLWSRPGFLVRRLNQIHYAMFYEECKSDLTPVQHGVLSVLMGSPWLDQTTIGYELGLDRTTSADVIRRLEEKGLLGRRINPDDRRSRQTYITEAGLAAMQEISSGMNRAQERLLDPLTAKQRQTFMSMLTRVVEHNNQYGRAALKNM
ncbi:MULTISPECIES: MarR family winged helix-turn-helix transcriptional regulator [Alcaligenes]|uniref:MarR family transcriptional regulator n=2 Tax=Alcaligenes TaxID=507 RepID=A0A3G2HXM3_9BURK|nr:MULTISPECIES: MarR family transcriptional regulator [Alcaligenes]ARS01286.1 PicR [Alcaligenes faecalis]ASR90676.1 PicR. MarR-type negative regulator for picolinic acid biodegradation [Alcaligenes faecalis]AWG36657.1 MarR family transcriptional regulator [Alcaligenes aquatilis]AYN21916.1 MarR family transcriptional regulator [Alcaligenes aquatilis]MCC9164292.1 MarR family transcriptional regulator [Alcaligenes sp. MMA]